MHLAVAELILSFLNKLLRSNSDYCKGGTFSERDKHYKLSSFLIYNLNVWNVKLFLFSIVGGDWHERSSLLYLVRLDFALVMPKRLPGDGYSTVFDVRGNARFLRVEQNDEALDCSLFCLQSRLYSVEIG
jgi:hypothetical protein